MAKLLAADASAETCACTHGNGTAEVRFKINYKILYVPESAQSDGVHADIKAFTAVSEHTYTVKCDDLNENTFARAVCLAEGTEADFINSRKISIRTRVRANVFAVNTEDEGICTDISGSDDIQSQKKSMTVSVTEGTVEDTVIIDEDIELSGGKAAFKELLRTDAVLSDVSCSFADGFHIKGTLETCSFYVADDSSQSMQIIENEIPFTHTAEIEACSDDAVWRTGFCLNYCRAEICADSDGENRILHIEAGISVSGEAYAPRTFEFLDDAYSLSQKFTLEKGSARGMLIADDINGQFVLRDTAVRPDELPGISQIVNVTAFLGDTEVRVSDGHVSASGNIVCNVLYISDKTDTPAASFTANIPFTQNFESRQARDGMTAYADFEIHRAGFNVLSPSEAELRISVSAKITVIDSCELRVVNDITQPDDPFIQGTGDMPAILLYVVQSGDSLWKIAKRYNAPLELLKSVNQLKNPDVIMPGQKLLIPR